jgi:hypothetical protein
LDVIHDPRSVEKQRDMRLHASPRAAQDKRLNRIEFMFGRHKDWQRAAKFFRSAIAPAAAVIHSP